MSIVAVGRTSRALHLAVVLVFVLSLPATASSPYDMNEMAGNPDLGLSAYLHEQSSADMAVLEGERGKAALNLAKLVLIDMVKDVMDVGSVNPGLSLQGSTTWIHI